MKSIALQIAGFISFAGGIGCLVYSDERVVGLLITILAAGLLLIGFAALLALVWFGARALVRAAFAVPPPPPPQTRSGRPAVPAYSTAQGKR